MKAGKKAFLFLGLSDAMFKLTGSAAEATRLGLKVGKNGWVSVKLDGAPPLARLEKWVDESYRAVAVPSREVRPGVTSRRRRPRRRARSRGSRAACARARAPRRR